jgi:hypothetical protein
MAISHRIDLMEDVPSVVELSTITPLRCRLLLPSQAHRSGVLFYNDPPAQPMKETCNFTAVDPVRNGNRRRGPRAQRLAPVA